MPRVSAQDLIDQVLDPGTFASWDEPAIPPSALDESYAAELEQARAKTGLDEAVRTGEASLGGHRVAVLLGEFDFLAGSIGIGAAERLVSAIERATAARLPIVASPTSGGTRMQEGTVAFVQMVRIAAAVHAHRAAGLPYLVYLRHPTTGGVFASWGSLGHVTAAEPGALVGFLGPRVYEALYGEPFPDNVQQAENLYAKGLVDAVANPRALRRIATNVLDVVLAPRVPSTLPDDPGDLPVADVPAWESIERSRRPERPGIRRLLKTAANTVSPLSGTGWGENDPGVLLALAKFGEVPCVVVAQDRRGPRPLGPAALRTARRGMALAAELKLPLVTVLDTAGAALSVEAEEGGLAGEIARCLAELATLDAPTLSVLLGQGTGGGALALLPADRVLCAQHGWLSPLPPEGASVIRHRTVDRAGEMAAAQGVRSLDLLKHRIVDRVVAETPDAADEPREFLTRLGAIIQAELARLAAADVTELRRTRLDRYRPQVRD